MLQEQTPWAGRAGNAGPEPRGAAPYAYDPTVSYTDEKIRQMCRCGVA